MGVEESCHDNDWKIWANSAYDVRKFEAVYTRHTEICQQAIEVIRVKPVERFRWIRDCRRMVVGEISASGGRIPGKNEYYDQELSG